MLAKAIHFNVMNKLICEIISETDDTETTKQIKLTVLIKKKCNKKDYTKRF